VNIVTHGSPQKFLEFYEALMGYKYKFPITNHADIERTIENIIRLSGVYKPNFQTVVLVSKWFQLERPEHSKWDKKVQLMLQSHLV
jgi:hypothetical protein